MVKLFVWIDDVVFFSGHQQLPSSDSGCAIQFAIPGEHPGGNGAFVQYHCDRC